MLRNALVKRVNDNSGSASPFGPNALGISPKNSSKKNSLLVVNNKDINGKEISPFDRKYSLAEPTALPPSS